ncbi:MAG: D-alanine--D-alanine ligase [Clostridia bacterium]|nr:D-alanine--D-alanine ligase [Clostridia bacterium]
MNIVVLAGGISPERDVSLTSAALIANALTKSSHKVLLVDVYEGLAEGVTPSLDLFSDKGDYTYKVEEDIPDLDEIIRRNGGRKALIGPGVLEVCALADVVYIGLHGAMGENGQLQATLDNYGIRYTGSGYIGSLLAMDKDITKKLLSLEGIPTPSGVLCDMKKDNIREIVAGIGLPCVIKPCSCGSSVGVSIIENEDELESALAFAEKYENKILIEKKIVGREMTVAILDGEVLPAIEIIPKNGYYDYKNKYQSGMTEEICPAPITKEACEKMADYTRRAFEALNLRGLARMDYILTEDGEAYCLEANTLPGMTPTSLLPQAAAAVGIGYEELCDKIVKMAVR